MQVDWQSLLPAIVFSLIMAPLHAVFGLHVIKRGVIFIDLAVAQVAACGMAFAMARGLDHDSPAVYWTSVGSALFGALLISLTRFRLGRIPHEAMIGIIFVLGSAGSIIALQYADHGQELLDAILNGQILFVFLDDIEGGMSVELKRTLIVYGVLGVLAGVFWKRIKERSEKSGSVEGVKGTALDFLFYSMIGVMVATSVQIAGVLVVFTWLVMPAVIAWMWTGRLSKALMLAIPLSWVGSVAGIYLSSTADAENVELGGWPMGASIVVAFGAIVAVSYIVRLMIREKTTDA